MPSQSLHSLPPAFLLTDLSGDTWRDVGGLGGHVVVASSGSGRVEEGGAAPTGRPPAGVPVCSARPGELSRPAASSLSSTGFPTRFSAWWQH